MDSEEVDMDLIQNAKDCHSHDLTVTENITPARNVYDDEIWESSGGALWNPDR